MATINSFDNQVLAANVTFNGGTMNIGSDATDNAINIGTAANAGRTVTIGNGTGTSTSTIDCGTGGANFGTTNNLHTTTIGTANTNSVSTINSGAGGINLTAANGDVTVRSGSGTIYIGNDAVQHGVIIGNTTGTTSVTVDCGTNGASFGASATAHTTTVGSVTGASATTVQGGSGALNVTATGGALTINSGTGTLAISNDASATTVNIATGGAVKTISIGNAGFATTISARNTVSITNGNLSISAGNVLLPTTSSTVGQIQINAVPVFHTYGTNNTFVGESAGNFTLTVASSRGVTGIGYKALNALTAGADCNTACGDQSLASCTISPANTALGYNALNALTTGAGYNTAIGCSAGNTFTTGQQNIFIGDYAGSSCTGSDSYNILINHTGSAGLNNTTRIGYESQQTAAYIAGNVTTTTAVAGGTRTLTVSNTDNTNAASAATIIASTGGANAGDAKFQATTTTTTWSLGVDNSVTAPTADPFVISQGTALGTNNTFVIQNTGEITMPLQSAFLAYLASKVFDVTGNGTAYTLGTGTALTEVFDQNSDFNTNGTFTAPVTGRYSLGMTVQIVGTTTSSLAIVYILTSNRTYVIAVQRAASNFFYGITLNVLADMDIGDTAVVTIYTYGEAADTDDLEGGAPVNTGFWGHLEC